MLVLRQHLWGCCRRLDTAEAWLPIDLELCARGAERLLRGRRLPVAGRIRAARLAIEAELGGTLRFGSRAAPLLYELEFPGALGERCRLAASVRFDPRRPLLSLSSAAGTLRAGSGVCYEVELRYDYRRDLRSLLHRG